MKKIITMLTLIAIMSIFTSSLLAQRFDRASKKQHELKEEKEFNRNHHNHNMEGKNQKFSKENHLMMACKNLELTSAQEKKLEEINIKHRKTIIDQKAEVEKLNIDKKSAMQNENFTQAKRLTEQIGKIKTDMEKIKIEHIENIMKELTTEQKEQLKEMRRNHPKRR